MRRAIRSGLSFLRALAAGEVRAFDDQLIAGLTWDYVENATPLLF